MLGAAAFPGQQNFNNCGVQSVGEIVFLRPARGSRRFRCWPRRLQRGSRIAAPAGAPGTAGGTYPADRQNLLSLYGVASNVVNTTQAAMGTAIRNGQGVIVNVDAGTLWGNPAMVGSGHAVVVTEENTDAAGNLQTVTVNDTGRGTRTVMPAANLVSAANARPGGSQMNVTQIRFLHERQSLARRRGNRHRPRP